MNRSRNCDQIQQSLEAAGDKADTGIAEHFAAAEHIDSCVADGDHIVVAAQGIDAVVAAASTPDDTQIVAS